MTLPDNDLFSIIVPTYNRARIIAETLDSVKKQTYRPIEIIVIDDGSTDHTKDEVESWASSSSEGKSLSVRYFYQENAGAGAARNRGIEKINGEFVQFLDSDDLLHPARLARLVEVFEQTPADFIQTGFESIDAESGEVIRRHYARPNENLVELALRGLLWANTLRSAFRKNLVDRIGPWEAAMTCFEDREYVERAVVKAEHPVAIEEILASARRGGSERVSDQLRTYEGRKLRILCEQRLYEGVRGRVDISNAAKQAFASRLYALGFRSRAAGWPDLGKRCADLAQCIDVKLDQLGRRRRLIYWAGPWAARTYSWAHHAKKLLTGLGIVK